MAKGKKDKISKYYSEWWENPKDPRNIVFEGLNSLVKERIPPGNNKKALDIGSGKGRIVSYLLEKGYRVTAVEMSDEFVNGLRKRFPTIRVIQCDVCELDLNECFDVVTMIELAQNLKQEELRRVLNKLAKITPYLLINISNSNSLHGKWVEFRGFRNDFVFMYTPKEIESILKSAGFSIVYRKGIGLVTPISLFSGFKCKLIPIWLAEALNDKFDKYATRFCHLYYVEARSLRKSLEETQAER